MSRYAWKFLNNDEITFLSDDKKELKCDACNDETLYHDSIAYFDETTHRVVCEMCRAKENSKAYIKVITYH
jgi:Zn finger protein HypA/HybF involved in hydrogenase expression